MLTSMHPFCSLSTTDQLQTPAIYLPNLLCVALKRFPDNKPLDLKGLVAIEQLAAWDPSNVLVLERQGAYGVIMDRMKVGLCFQSYLSMCRSSC